MKSHKRGQREQGGLRFNGFYSFFFSCKIKLGTDVLKMVISVWTSECDYSLNLLPNAFGVGWWGLWGGGLLHMSNVILKRCPSFKWWWLHYGSHLGSGTRPWDKGGRALRDGGGSRSGGSHTGGMTNREEPRLQQSPDEDSEVRGAKRWILQYYRHWVTVGRVMGRK